MPEIRCAACGGGIMIDGWTLPYMGELTCPECKVGLQVTVAYQTGTTVSRRYPGFDELSSVWNKLSEIERASLREASLCVGTGAFTAAEAMALRTLEAILRRIYNVDEMFGDLVKRMETDKRLKELGGIFQYFKETRNRVAHPEKLSLPLDADSTFQMTKRLILEVLQKI